MKKATAVLSIIFIFLASCAGRGQSGVLIEKETGEESVYSLEILSLDEIETDAVKDWVNGSKEQASADADGKPVYYAVYRQDLDAPIEMYLFMPLAQAYMGDISLSNVRVYQSGAALVLDIETKDRISRKKASTDLILHVYVTGPPDQATAQSEWLIINGVKYDCPSYSFTKLR